jgi:hypothetical protein
MDHLLSVGLLKVSPGQEVKILFMQQNGSTCIIDVQKLLKVIKGIGSLDGFGGRVGEAYLVFCSQIEKQVRFKGALDVEM